MKDNKLHLNRFGILWSHARDSFWLLPLLLALSAVGLYALTTALDQRWPEPGLFNGLLIFHGGANAARELLSTLASSMITVAGVVFSITIVVLTLASNQLGPRLIPSFMSDPGNQWALGIFVATFIYCVLVLQRVYGGDGGGYVPNISIKFSILMALINSVVLILYIHHIAVAIQADQVVNGVAREMNKTIEKMIAKKAEPLPEESGAELMRVFDEKRGKKVITIRAGGSGYVQSIDTEKLLELAVKVDGVFRLECRPGDYKLPATVLLTAALNKPPSDGFGREVRDLIVLGKIRTPEHDIEFSLEQLVEVALRALSPGLNDPFTAVTCIDKLSSALELFGEAESPPYMYDKSGRVRLIRDQSTFAGVLDAAFNQIRQTGASHPAVMIRMLERIADMLISIRRPQQRKALLEYAQVINQNVEKADLTARDRQDIADRYRAVMSTVSTA